jgi:hypothetical protein
MSEEALAALITRDAMIGVASCPPSGTPGGVHDMGGQRDGSVQYEARAWPRALGGRLRSCAMRAWGVELDADRHGSSLAAG